MKTIYILTGHKNEKPNHYHGETNDFKTCRAAKEFYTEKYKHNETNIKATFKKPYTGIM